MLEQVLDALGVEDVLAARQLNTRLVTELRCKANIAQVVRGRAIAILAAASRLNAGQTGGLVGNAATLVPALLMHFLALCYRV